MATPMLRARQAIRIIDKFDRATAESKRAALNPPTAGEPVSDLDSNTRGLDNSLPETGAARSSSLEPVADLVGERTLQRPPSHTTVDIPELASRDSATVSFCIDMCSPVRVFNPVMFLRHALNVGLTAHTCSMTCSVL